MVLVWGNVEPHRRLRSGRIHHSDVGNEKLYPPGKRFEPSMRQDEIRDDGLRRRSARVQHEQDSTGRGAPDKCGVAGAEANPAHTGSEAPGRLWGA